MTETQPTETVDSAGQGFEAVVAEIMAEAERRRSSGEYSTEMLEHLDAEFDRFAPLTYRRTGIDGAIRAVESAAFINVDVPTGASRRPFEMVKEAIKKSTAWYHLHIARQVTTLGIQVTRPLRMLAERQAEFEARIAAIEADRSIPSALIDETLRASRAHDPRNREGSHRADPGRLDRVAAALDHVAGRALVVGADAIAADNIATHHRDSYFVGTDAIDSASPASDSVDSLDIRGDDASQHLGELADDVLGAVVLCGTAVETSSNTARVELVHHAVRAVHPGGRLIVVAPDRSRWETTCDPVEADLAPGSPWRPDTWSALLTRLGCRSVSIDDLDSGHLVVASIA